MAWVTFWYLSFQLPLAFVSTAGLGMAYAVQEFFTLNKIEGEITLPDRVLSMVGEFALSTFAVINEISSYLFGISFDPMILFIVPFALIFLLGIFQLILVWFIYSFAGIKSLSGRAAGAKNTLFLLAGIGYALPILNLFPLIILWMLVVWRYPK